MSDDISITLVTCPESAAESLARQLVDTGLAACVNLLPQLRSLYRWQGEIRSDTEVLLLIKHPASGFDALCDAVQQHHPYEVPEIVELPVQRGLPAYLRWVADSCTSG